MEGVTWIFDSTAPRRGRGVFTKSRRWPCKDRACFIQGLTVPFLWSISLFISYME